MLFLDILINIYWNNFFYKTVWLIPEGNMAKNVHNVDTGIAFLNTACKMTSYLFFTPSIEINLEDTWLV